jgi:ribulose-phosphate 3-epimerase
VSADPALRGPQIAPSILAADMGRLREQVQQVADAGARIVHVDIMDGHFVPPLSMGPGACAALRDLGLHLEVHLMVEHPERTQIDAFAAAGAGTIIVHAEATPNVHYALQAIRAHGCRAGLAVCPATPLEVFREVELDVALLMTVNPGWGGQAFIPESYDRLRRLREIVGPDVEIEVDGGVDRETAAPARAAGASRFVAGTAVFGAPDPAAAFAELTGLVGG